MIEADRPKFVELLFALGAGFNRALDEATFAAFWLALDDVPIERVALAVRTALKTRKFFPAPSELRESSGELPPATRALIAWEALCRAVTEVGGYGSVLFDDAAIGSTVRQLGGWARVCDTPADQFDVWLRKDFLQLYVANLVRPITSNPALLGIFDRPPVTITTGLVGDTPLLEGPTLPAQAQAAIEQIGRMPRRGDDAA